MQTFLILSSFLVAFILHKSYAFSSNNLVNRQFLKYSINVAKNPALGAQTVSHIQFSNSTSNSISNNKVLPYVTIYKIVCKITETFYIGSTSSTLKRALSQLKSRYHRYLEESYPRYVSVYDILGYENYEILPIQSYSNIDKFDLIQKKRSLIESTDKCVNKLIPGRSNAEYYNDNRQHLLSYKKKYRELKRDEIIAYKSQYRLLKKEFIQRKMCQRYECTCGSTIRWADKAEHFRSKKHLNFMRLKRYLNG